MKHQHTYDEHGNQLCCTPQEGKIYKEAGAKNLVKEGKSSEKSDKRGHEHTDDDGHDHDHESTDKSTFQLFLPSII